MPSNPPSGGTLCGENISPKLPSMEETIDETLEPVTLDFDARITSINGQFQLSTIPDFQPNFTPVIVSCVGMVSITTRGNLVILSDYFRGKAEVHQANGLVNLFGQRSFKQAKEFAEDIASRFRVFSDQKVAVHDLKFNVLFCNVALPFRLNIHRLGRMRSDIIQFNAEIDAGQAKVKYPDYSLYHCRVTGGGKMSINGSGDCDPPNDDFPNLLALIRRVVQDIYCCKVADSEHRPLSPTSPEPPARAARPRYVARRSERLISHWQNLGDSDDSSDEEVQEEHGNGRLSNLPVLEKELARVCLKSLRITESDPERFGDESAAEGAIQKLSETRVILERSFDEEYYDEDDEPLGLDAFVHRVLRAAQKEKQEKTAAKNRPKTACKKRRTE